MEAWQALHISPTFSKLLAANPACHIAAHHAAFSASAICKVQLILRSCGSGVGGAVAMAGLKRSGGDGGVERNGMQHVLRRG
ncbi:MAG: hypothetical protein KAT65_06675, partial [Methanophagales archaeon]|nr:hypothetical protein [Methanophagales archaeon]